jgi:fused signal recognition particle receptor
MSTFIKKTATSLRSRLGTLFGGGKTFSLQDREKLEEALLLSDMGPKTAVRIVDALAKKAPSGKVDGETLTRVAVEEIEKILTDALPSDSFLFSSPSPAQKTRVLVLLGVNGSGKTTTAGKIAYHFKEKHQQKVLMAACDTFRAAAVQQLEIWGERVGVKVIKGAPQSDSAGVAFEALKTAREEQIDWLIVDTAGRLHTNKNLMEELKKIVRVLKKQDPEVSIETLLVLDGGTGQNAIVQGRVFHEGVGLTGLLVTKLDGTAKAGILLPLVESMHLPVVAIGTGETLEALEPFDIPSFAHGLIGEDPANPVKTQTKEEL